MGAASFFICKNGKDKADSPVAARHSRFAEQGDQNAIGFLRAKCEQLLGSRRMPKKNPLESGLYIMTESIKR